MSYLGLINNGTGSAEWGEITGTLSNQTDLQSALDSKVNKAGDTMTGTMEFLGDGLRLKANMGGGTAASTRFAIQTNGASSDTALWVLPSGSSTFSSVHAFNNSDPSTASSRVLISIGNTTCGLSSEGFSGGAALPLTFNMAGAETARIDANGHFLIGTTTSFEPATNTGAVSGAYFNKSSNYLVMARSGGGPLHLQQTAGTGPLCTMWSGTTSVGSIAVNTTNTAYNTSSDYRLKENIRAFNEHESGQFIDAMIPRKGKWIVDGSEFVGFVAHELQQVSPSSVMGEKDGDDYQQIDCSTPEIMANIVAELQSLRSRVASLESEVETLKSQGNI